MNKKYIIGGVIILLIMACCCGGFFTGKDKASLEKKNKEKEIKTTATNKKTVATAISTKQTPMEKQIATIEPTVEPTKKISTEYKNALKKAENYSKTMHMSKKGIYDQLTSQYGEKFPADAAQYAIDNVKADWNKNALEKAKTYQSSMSMSKNAIYDQLISQYGEKFTASEAQYAIDHL